MAVVPALATMAALTLLQNPAAQPEGVSVDYSPFAGPARRIQRAIRGLLRRRAETRDWNIRRYRGEASVWLDPLMRDVFFGPGFGVISYRPDPGDLRVYDWDAMRRSIWPI